jgi:hypothetical protein
MNPIQKALNVEKLTDYNVKDVTKPAVLNSEHLDFINEIIDNETPVLVVYDRDTDGTTGMAGGLYASNIGTLPPSWHHTYAWGSSDISDNQSEDKKESSGTFGVSTEQVRHFFDSKSIPNDSEVVIFTVDNGATSELVQKQLKKDFPNIKFFITDHHLSTDNTRKESEYFVNPSDDYNKSISDWVAYTDKESGNITESHVSGGMLWNLILRELAFDKKYPEYQGIREHRILDYVDNNPMNFHYSCGLFSQWCDLITFGPDFEECFRIHLQNGNLQKLPIFKHVQSLEWSGMSQENWVSCFREKVRKVASISNTTKRLDFLLDSPDFQATLDSTGIELDGLNKKYDGSLSETLKKWNSEVAEQLKIHFPSLELGGLPPLKYVYLFNIHESTPEMMEIIKELADIKNAMLKLNDYSKNSLENTQFFFTENPKMRGITSIKCFIEKDRPVLFNLSPDSFNDDELTLKGSYRSDIAELFDAFNTSKFKYGTIQLQGHSKAAGATFTFKDEDKAKFYGEIDDLVTETMNKVNYAPQQLDLISYSDIEDTVDELISNQNYYVFSQPLKFVMRADDLIEDNNVEVKTSKKSGMQYISHKDYRSNIATQGFNVDKFEDNEFVVVELSVIPNRTTPMVQIALQDDLYTPPNLVNSKSIKPEISLNI